MPASFEAREDGHVVFINFSDPLTVGDLYTMFKQDKAHRDQFHQKHPDRKVHLVADSRELKAVPQGLLQARQSPSLNHPTSGQIAVIGARNLVRALTEAIFRLTRFDRAVFFDNEEDAMAYIRQVIANGDKPVK